MPNSYEFSEKSLTSTRPDPHNIKRKVQLGLLCISTVLLAGCGSQSDTLTANQAASSSNNLVSKSANTTVTVKKPTPAPSQPVAPAPSAPTPSTPTPSNPAPTSPATPTAPTITTAPSQPVTTPTTPTTPDPVPAAPVPTPSVPTPVAPTAQNTRMYGVIQAQLSRLKTDYDAGIRVRTLELAWDAAELGDQQWNSSYFAAKKAEYDADIAAGYKVDLNFGMQYPPKWLLARPDSHFVDQHGNIYDNAQPGANPLNTVFSQAMRDQQADYMHHVFTMLGTNFASVRLGFGYYGEIGFPPVSKGNNSYWGFDAIATGQHPGLAAGLTPNPLPNWQAVTDDRAVTADERAQAQTLSTWYLNALGNYQDWQIQMARRDYSGRLFMLYPSFGLRPGQLQLAVEGGLRGKTSAEINTELQRGFDFERLVNRIQDRMVSPYTTWLDMSGPFVDDNSSDMGMWSLAHYLSALAARHPLNLQVWGENTGEHDFDALKRCAQRAKDYNFGGMFWAFNEQLYDGQHATIDQMAEVIATYQ